MTIFAEKKKSMTYPNFSSKWKYLVLIIVCAIFPDVYNRLCSRQR